MDAHTLEAFQWKWMEVTSSASSDDNPLKVKITIKSYTARKYAAGYFIIRNHRTNKVDLQGSQQQKQEREAFLIFHRVSKLNTSWYLPKGRESIATYSVKFDFDVLSFLRPWKYPESKNTSSVVD